MNYYQVMQSQAQLSRHNILLARSQTPKHSELIPKRRGVWAPTYVSTEQHYMPESTTTEGAPVARGPIAEEANAIGDSRKKKKRQRQKHTHPWLQLTRAQFQAVDSRQNLDANQSSLIYSCSRTRIPPITCACTSGISGYIKGVE